jgi:hypothetical protein
VKNVLIASVRKACKGRVTYAWDEYIGLCVHTRRQQAEHNKAMNPPVVASRRPRVMASVMASAGEGESAARSSWQSLVVLVKV